MTLAIRIFLAALCWIAAARATWAAEDKTVDIGNNVVLHYVEQGAGPTVIFVHGSLSDYGYWEQQMAPFAAHFHVVAYSRRYNPPNTNPSVRGYSAAVDAEDLAALIATLKLGKVYLVGHSYGALTGLFLAARHPEMIRAAVLAEPPAMSLLEHLPQNHAAEGRHMYADVQQRMVAPMKQAFLRHDTAAGVEIFLNYVFADPTAWSRMSAADRSDALKGAHEWEVILPAGELFPAISPKAVRSIHVPILLMSGGKSYPFLRMIDEALDALLPNARHVVYEDTGHQMWLRHPAEARAETERFFAAHS